MTTWKRALAGVLLGGLLVVTAACGGAKIEAGTSEIVVTDITSPLPVFLATPFVITGENFLSVSGTNAIVRFTAQNGTPFAGGTSATAEVAGTIDSNTQVSGTSPTTAFVGSFNAYVTVILPSTASGTSFDPIAQFLGVATEARDDDFNTIGNVRLERDAASGLLANDDPAGFASVINFDAVSTSGGGVSVDPDGAFTYDPPAGFEGTDTFTYEIDGGVGTDTATVTVEVAEMVWFLDVSAAAGGDGRQETPFNTVIAFNAIQGGLAGPGDTIWLYYAGGAPYSGAMTLLADQVLLGQGVDLEVAGTVLETALANPLLTDSSGTTLTLGTSNTVRGLDLSNTGGGGLLGSGTGTLALDTVNVEVTGGAAVALNGMDGAAVFGTVQSTGSPTEGVRLLGVDGTVAFAGRTTVTNAATFGVNVDTGTGAVTFDGLDITGTAGDGIIHGPGASLSVTGSGNDVVTTTGRPLVLFGTIGAAGITLESVSCDGASHGIQMGDTGPFGILTVTGDGTGVRNGSGGTLRNCVGTAVSLAGTPGVSLTQLDIENAGVHGVLASNADNVVYRDASIVGAGDAANEYAFRFFSSHGENVVDNVLFDDINVTAISVSHTSADDAVPDLFTFQNVEVLDHTPAGFGEHGISLDVQGTADVDVLIDSCTFDINADGALGVEARSYGTATLVCTVRESTFDAGDAFGSGSIQMIAADTSTATFNVLDNDLNLSPFTAILINNDDSATSYATVMGNDIDFDPVTHNGFGISMRQDEEGTFTALIEDNTIDGSAFDAIRITARDSLLGTGTMNVTILDNTAGMPSLFGAGIFIDARDDNTLCANMSGNDVSGTLTFAGFDDDITLSQGDTAVINVTQTAPTAAVDASELDDANNNAVVGTNGVITYGQPACPTPPVLP